MDNLVVSGLGRILDGEYEFDLHDLVSPDAPSSMTGEEREAVKNFCGVRMGEVGDSLDAMDSGLILALAQVIMGRADKPIDKARLLQCRVLVSTTSSTRDRQAFIDARSSFVEFVLEEVAEEAEDSPPAEPAETPEQTSENGGKSSVLTLANLENGQSRTGLPDLAKSVTYDHRTSAP